MSNHRLIVKNLTVSYDRVPALHHIDLELSCGHCIGLLGPNGAGKTTLIRALANLIDKESGSIELKGHFESKLSPRISYLPQRSAVDWDFPITVRGMVEMGRFPELGAWKSFSAHDRSVVQEALSVTKLLALADRQINALSGGQQQRAFLARAWAQEAEVYLLDEPFAALDANAQSELQVLLHEMVRLGKLIVVSHHDLKSVPELFDRVILLNGELIASGTLAEAFTSENIARTYSVPAFTGEPR